MGNIFAYRFKNKCIGPLTFARKKLADGTLHLTCIKGGRESSVLFIFILQRAGLVRIDVRLPSGALAAQQALNNSKNQQEERVIHQRVETMCWGGRGDGRFLYGARCIKLRGKLSLQPRVWAWAWGGFQEEPLGLHQPLRPTDQLWRANSPQLCLFLSLLIYHTVWWLASVLCTPSAFVSFH